MSTLDIKAYVGAKGVTVIRYIDDEGTTQGQYLNTLGNWVPFEPFDVTPDDGFLRLDQ